MIKTSTPKIVKLVKTISEKFNLGDTEIYLWDVFLFFISVTSLTTALLLALQKFYILPTLALSLFIVFLSIKILKIKISLKDPRFDKVLLVILLLALVFRLPPYLYLLGGQDQGTYVNISKQYEISHALFAVDHYRETLNKEQQKLYDKEGNYLMPSIEKWNRPNSEYSMALYPLHPAWMSIFGNLFGTNNRVYSLTMFSLISIISFYLLAYEISGKKKRIGYVVALLLAVNPLHAFFSKLPVSEIVALALTSSGFYYLVKYFNEATRKNIKYFYLVLSALLITAFNFTRMSSFLYVPFFYLISLAVVLYVKEKQVKIHLLLYVAFLITSFWLSYRYYAIFMSPLYDLVYPATITQLLKVYLDFIPVDLEIRLRVIGIIALIIFVLTTLLTKWKVFKKVMVRDANFVPIAIGLFFILLLLIFVQDITNLKFLTPDPINRYGTAGFGWMSVKNHSLYIILLYTGLVAFISYLIANFCLPFIKIYNKSLIILLDIFVIFFIAVNTLFTKEVLYHYYFSRYFLTEAVPYLLLFVVLFLGNFRGRKIDKVWEVILVVTFLYFAFFTSVQLYGKEMPKLNFYNKLRNTVSDKDLLMFYISSPPGTNKYEANFDMYAFAPFKWYYNLHTLVLSKPDDFNLQEVINLMAKSEKTYLLTNEKIDNSKLILLSSEKLTYNDFNVSSACNKHTYEFLSIEKTKTLPIPEFAECLTVPNVYYTRYKNYYLYEVRGQ